jgi:phage-related holin
MMQGMFYTFSNGYFPVEMSYSNADEVRYMFGFYAIGFILLCCNFIAFYGHALNQQHALNLNQHERFDTLTDLILWSVTALVCSLSLLGAFILPNNLLEFCGFIYFLVPLTLLATGILRGKRRKLLVC